MSPLSVLRIWGLGLFSWALLGLGIYLAVKAYDEFDDAAAVAHFPGGVPAFDDARLSDNQLSDNQLSDNQLDNVRPAEELDDDLRADRRRAADGAVVLPRDGNRPKAWALVAGAVACLGMSLFGYWPISWMLRGGTNKPRSQIKPTETVVVGRPDGSQLHVEVYGSNSRPTLLLTHGWTLDASAWDYIKGDLANRYRIVAWDLPGLGRSRGPNNADYSLEKMAGDLEAVMHATSTSQPTVLVGHSIGGMIVQNFCRLFPHHLTQSVHGVVLIHTTYINPLRTITAATLCTALEKPLIVPLNYLTIALAPLAWLSNWQSYYNGSLHLTSRLMSFTGHQSWEQIDHSSLLAARAWPATVARGNLGMFKLDEASTLSQLPISALVVGGANDLVTRPFAARRISELVPNDRPVTDPGGHLGYWEFSDIVIESIDEFMQGLSATGKGALDPSLAHTR